MVSYVWRIFHQELGEVGGYEMLTATATATATAAAAVESIEKEVYVAWVLGMGGIWDWVTLGTQEEDQQGSGSGSESGIADQELKDARIGKSGVQTGV